MTASDRQALYQIGRAFMASRVLLTAAELNLFQAFADGPRTAQEAAVVSGTDPRATEILLDTLVALALLGKSEGCYALPPLSRRHLLSDSPDSLRAMLAHQEQLWRRWSHLSEVVRTGQPAPREGEQSAGHRAFIRAMQDHKRGESLHDWLPLDLSGVTRAIDLGGGPGTLAVALARALPSAQVVLYDRPATLRVAAEMVPTDLWGGRVKPRAGDLVTDERYGEGFDLAILSAVLHAYGSEVCQRMVRRAAEALGVGGRLVIREFLLDEDRAGPLREALFSVNMLVSTPRGRTYTRSEIETWMRLAGLGDIRVMRVEKGAALVGVKA